MSDINPCYSKALGKMRFWEITRPLRSDMTIYPGDPSFTRRITSEGGVTISEICMGSHTGTHMDAPLHMLAGGASIESLPLEGFLQPAHVVSIPQNGAVSPEMVRSGVHAGEALLIKAPKGNEEEAVPIFLLPETADFLVDQGVSLVGIDSLSVESGADKAFPVHRKLLTAEVVILEGIRLDHIPDGSYHLMVLPMLIHGGDGAPARAILVENF